MEEDANDCNEVPDVSLITGHLRPAFRSPSYTAEPLSSSLVERNEETTLSTQNRITSAEFLASRSWKGLEQNLGETPVTKAVEGKEGIAAGYTDERDLEKNS